MNASIDRTLTVTAARLRCSTCSAHAAQPCTEPVYTSRQAPGTFVQRFGPDGHSFFGWSLFIEVDPRSEPPRARACTLGFSDESSAACYFAFGERGSAYCATSGWLRLSRRPTADQAASVMGSFHVVLPNTPWGAGPLTVSGSFPAQSLTKSSSWGAKTGNCYDAGPGSGIPTDGARDATPVAADGRADAGFDAERLATDVSAERGAP